MHGLRLHLRQLSVARGHRRGEPARSWSVRVRRPATSLAAVLALITGAMGVWATAANATTVGYDFQTDGDNNIATGLLQHGPVACDSSGGTKTFDAAHQENDLLLAAAFTNGGGTATIDVYKWHLGALTQIGSEFSHECDDSLTLTLGSA